MMLLSEMDQDVNFQCHVCIRITRIIVYDSMDFRNLIKLSMYDI